MLPAFRRIFQYSRVLAVRAWARNPESLVSPFSSLFPLLRLLPNLVDNLVNRVLANVLPDLVRTYPETGSKEHGLSPYQEGGLGDTVLPPSVWICR